MCVRYGADVNAQNVRLHSQPCVLHMLVMLISAAQSRGNTALHFAVAYGFAALADWLRRSGAQPAMRNVAGRAAIEGIGPEGDF
jgi:ankyrin repeat protein